MRIALEFAKAVVISSAAFFALAGPGAADDVKRDAIEKLTSKALEGNLTGDSPVQDIRIHLPESYGSGDKRYPVVYFLHGYQDSIYSAETLIQAMDDAVADGLIGETIFVVPNGINAMGGAFFVNSPVVGNWEDYIVKEVVPFIDGKYRTIAKAPARAITGFSMGGYGAVNLGLRHPDVFSVAYAMAPGLMTDDGLGEAFASWDETFLNAYGAAFAPRPDQPEPHAAVLTKADIGTGNAVEQAWLSGYGDIVGKVSRYVAGTQRLTAMRVDYGRYDSYAWIPKGSIQFAEAMKKAGVPIEQDGRDCGHQLDRNVFLKGVVPFLSRNLRMD